MDNKIFIPRVTIPVTLLYDKRIKPIHLSVYLILIRFTDGKGSGNFSARDIAKVFDLSPRRIINILHHLRDVGVIEIEERMGKKSIFRFNNLHTAYFENKESREYIVGLLSQAGEISF